MILLTLPYLKSTWNGDGYRHLASEAGTDPLLLAEAGPSPLTALKAAVPVAAPGQTGSVAWFSEHPHTP